MNKRTQPNRPRNAVERGQQNHSMSMRIRSQGLKPPASRSVMACWYLPATYFLDEQGLPTAKSTAVFNMFKHLAHVLSEKYHLVD